MASPRLELRAAHLRLWRERLRLRLFSRLLARLRNRLQRAPMRETASARLHRAFGDPWRAGHLWPMCHQASGCDVAKRAPAIFVTASTLRPADRASFRPVTSGPAARPSPARFAQVRQFRKNAEGCGNQPFKLLCSAVARCFILTDKHSRLLS